jgi:hypothetical protein
MACDKASWIAEFVKLYNGEQKHCKEAWEQRARILGIEVPVCDDQGQWAEHTWKLRALVLHEQNAKSKSQFGRKNGLNS